MDPSCCWNILKSFNSPRRTNSLPALLQTPSPFTGSHSGTGIPIPDLSTALGTLGYQAGGEEPVSSGQDLTARMKTSLSQARKRYDAHFGTHCSFSFWWLASCLLPAHVPTISSTTAVTLGHKLGLPYQHLTDAERLVLVSPSHPLQTLSLGWHQVPPSPHFPWVMGCSCTCCCHATWNQESNVHVRQLRICSHNRILSARGTCVI